LLQLNEHPDEWNVCKWPRRGKPADLTADIGMVAAKPNLFDLSGLLATGLKRLSTGRLEF